MASLSEMRYKVSDQQRINRELNSELNAISSGIMGAYSSWVSHCNHVTNTLSTGAARIQNANQAMIAAYELQGEIDNLYVLFKNMELANKKIRIAQNKKIYDFANYRAVRKVVTSMLDNLELQLVSDEAITRAVEVKHLQLPDFWLTCALLSIMAWRNDDKEFSDKALERACMLDKKNSAVFFMIFNMRIGRETAALKWFEYYQTCELTGDDEKTFLMLFTIVNEVIAQKCSDTVKSKVNAFINRIVKENMEGNGYSEEEMIDKIYGYTRRFVPNESFRYSTLARHCGDAGLLNYVMVNAKANVEILDFILKTVNVTDNERKDYLNNFLIDHVNKPNSIELEVEDEITYNQYIIDRRGDVGSAKEAFEDYVAHRENDFDIIYEMIQWIYKSEENINSVVRRSLFILTKDINKKAYEKHISTYRNAFKAVLSIRINDYETQANLQDFPGEAQKLKSFIESKKGIAMSKVKMWPAYLLFGLAVLPIVGAIALEAYWLLALTVILGIIGGGIVFGSSLKRKRIAKDYDNEYAVEEAVLKNLAEEYRSYLEEYKSFDSFSEKLLEEMDKI